jgi:hypothetical protein
VKEPAIIGHIHITVIPDNQSDQSNHLPPKPQNLTTMINHPASDGISSHYNTDSWLALVSEHIDSLSKSLRVLSLDIHNHPEIRNKEFHAHEILTSFIKEQKLQDWVVTPSAYGIATSFVAVFDSGRRGPVVSFNAEYGELVNLNFLGDF